MFLRLYNMLMTGLEPVRIFDPMDFKSIASADFATSAYGSPIIHQSASAVNGKIAARAKIAAVHCPAGHCLPESRTLHGRTCRATI